MVEREYFVTVTRRAAGGVGVGTTDGRDGDALVYRQYGYGIAAPAPGARG